LAVWLFYLFTPLISFKTVEIPQWLPFSTVVMPINFKLAQASWQISFLITGLMLGGIFSAIIDENHLLLLKAGQPPYLWQVWDFFL